MKPVEYFFSYSRKDADFAKKLATDLKKAGADVWLDQLDIIPGNAWDDAIQKALNEAHGVLAILSDTSTVSKNVMDEVSYAISQGKRIIPLIIEDCAVPFRLARLQHIDFTDDYDSAFQNLLKTLHSSETADTNLPAGAKISPASSFKEKYRVPVIIFSVIILIAVLIAFALIRNSKDKQVNNEVTHPGTNDSSAHSARPAAGSDSEQAAPLNNQANTSSGRINLFAPEAGTRILVASSDNWKYTIDNSEDMRQIDHGIGMEAVYGFKDDRPATFDEFTMLIQGTETFNIKEFELFAGNDSPTGHFNSIGKFQTQNVKLFKTPYQEFRFAPITAKYLKFKLISTYDWPHPNIYEFQLFGSLK